MGFGLPGAVRRWAGPERLKLFNEEERTYE